VCPSINFVFHAAAHRANRSDAPRQCGEPLARWAVSHQRGPVSQGDALGWVNARAFGPGIHLAIATLDRLVYELYGLTEEEIAIVEGATAEV
jgi:hypothetical protein